MTVVIITIIVIIVIIIKDGEEDEEKRMLAFIRCLLYLPGTILNASHIIFKFILTMII